MPDIERGVEAIIRNAMEEGAFDDLRGIGSACPGFPANDYCEERRT
jgi:hypothetical protein